MSGEKERFQSLAVQDAEGSEIIPEGFGGAERVRTAASQFCRLLPYHLGTAPRKATL